jgi:hypothetical protein
MERLDGREASHLREVMIEPGVAPYGMGGRKAEVRRKKAEVS